MRRSPFLKHPVLVGAAVAGTAALIGMALLNERRRHAAEREQPPAGKFLLHRGVRLHFLDQGAGEPVVMLHGNGSALQDFVASGLVDAVSTDRRVLAFDRPGFGYSARPRLRIWTAAAQADLIHGALNKLGIERYTVIGHSWGASVALEMALRHPEAVRAAVLVSGYYFPTPRADAVLSAGPAIPILGDVLRYTIVPPISRLAWPLVMKKIFRPAPVSRRFSAAVKGLALRPSQLRATAAESGLLTTNTLEKEARYRAIRLPVGIVAGQGDRLIQPAAQSVRLHSTIPNSLLDLVPRVGHMVHHSSPERVMAMLDKVEAAERARAA